MAARGDLEKPPVAQALFVQTLGQQQPVIGERHRQIDPGHLWISDGHRRLATCNNTGCKQ
ncbi:ParB N-terminal domain-containing protein [Pseudomonas alkylphenolica]|nr:ParB N-terminal domain-containing protein [Pseudomonas alkylphenolica]